MGVAGCAFCDVLEGRAEVQVVATTEHTVAFLDRSPVFYGHTLVIPREHYETLSDLPLDLVQPLFVEVQRIAGAVEGGFGAAGSFVAMNNRVSQSVPHLHVHIVPRNRKDGLRGFFWPRMRYRDEEHMAEVAAALRDALAG
jgi:histidine triad (HIT) family protein